MSKRLFLVPLFFVLIALPAFSAESGPSNTVGFLTFECPQTSWTPFAFPFTYYNEGHVATTVLNDIIMGDFTGGFIFNADLIYDQNDAISAYKNASGVWTGALTDITPGHAYWAKTTGSNPAVTAITAGEVDMSEVGLGTMAAESWTPVSLRDPGVVPLENSGLVESGFTGSPFIFQSDFIYDQNDAISAWYRTSDNTWQGALVAEGLIPGHAFWVKTYTGHAAFEWIYTPMGAPEVDNIFVEPEVQETEKRAKPTQDLRKVGSSN